MKRILLMMLTILLVLTCLSCSTPTITTVRNLIDDTADLFKPDPTPQPTPRPSRTPEPTPAPSASPEELEQKFLEELVGSMTLDEKVRQLFHLRIQNEDGYFTLPSDELAAFVRESKAGGYTIFQENIASFRDLSDMIIQINETAGIAPFIAIDEEGGEVSRLTAANLKGYENQSKASRIGQSGDPTQARQAAVNIGRALKEIGINMDFAPVCDVIDEGIDSAIGSRSFGSDPALVGAMASSFREGLDVCDVIPCAKHFPGQGAATGDPHSGASVLQHSQQQLDSIDYAPFRQMIQNDIPFIMVGHLAAPEIDDSGLPASLSPHFVTDELRGKLGFDGVIITDGMDMSAITDAYDPSLAALLAVEAGVDMILLPQDFTQSVAALTQAVENGDLSEDRLDESVMRILRVKLKNGLIKMNPVFDIQNEPTSSN